MGNYKHAQIRKDGTTEGESWLNNVEKRENLIPIEQDFDPWGKRWNGTDWEDCEPEPEPVLPLSEQEQIAIDTALNAEYIACLLEANLQ